MNKNTLYWIWLSLCFTWGSNRANETLLHFDDIEEYYKCTQDEMRKCSLFSNDELKMLCDKDLSKALKIVSDCDKLDISIVTIEDELYPKRLRSIYGAPLVLYYKGNISQIDDFVAISIVGTRDAVEYTRKVTSKIAFDLSRMGVIIVSGCAVGIDESAHFGALKGKGRTIGVMACGLDIDYPKENYLLRKEMLKRNGALISELPPGTGVRGGYFAARNRIIAGLSLGVLLTHTPVRSGSLLTAEHALEQGKEVYCVPPHDIYDSEFMGVMKYIRDGSTVIASADDILMDYYYAYSDKLLKARFIENFVYSQKQYDESVAAERTKENAHPKGNMQAASTQSQNTVSDLQEEKALAWDEDKDRYILELDEKQMGIYDLLTTEFKTAEEIAESSGIPMHEILSVLTDFEINGVVQSFSGLQYSRIHM